jgi:hypothetical protein
LANLNNIAKFRYSWGFASYFPWQKEIKYDEINLLETAGNELADNPI